MNGARAAALAVASLLFVRTAAWAQAPASAAEVTQATVDIGLSTAELRRNAASATAAGQALNRGADLALDHLAPWRNGSGWTRIAGRVGALYFVTLPLAAFSHTSAHEVGHLARIHESGVPVDRLRIDHWPWPVPYLRAEVVLGQTVADKLSDRVWLGLTGGGSEASQVQADALVDRIYSRDRTNYFDWVLLASAKLDMPVYIWRDLRAARLGSLDSFYGRGELFGDPRQYVLNYSRIIETARGYNEPGLDTIRATAQALRHGAWWNLADFSLWAGIARAAEYVVSGTRETGNPAIRAGRLGLLPAAHFVLTPLGPERGIGVRAVAASFVSRVDVRWIDPPTGSRLWAGGVALVARARPTFVPEVRADLWQRTGDRPGFRLELGGSRDVRVGGHSFGTSLAIGYKTSGYLAGTPDRRGILVSVGASIKF